MLLPENKPLGITVSLSHSQLQTQEHRQAAAVHTAPQAAGSFYIPAFLVSLDKPSPVKEGLKARLAAEGRWCVCVCVFVWQLKLTLKVFSSYFWAHTWLMFGLNVNKSRYLKAMKEIHWTQTHPETDTRLFKHICILDVLKSRPGNTRTERLIVAGRTMRQERLAQISRADTSST